MLTFLIISFSGTCCSKHGITSGSSPGKLFREIKRNVLRTKEHRDNWIQQTRSVQNGMTQICIYPISVCYIISIRVWTLPHSGVLSSGDHTDSQPRVYAAGIRAPEFWQKMFSFKHCLNYLPPTTSQCGQIGPLFLTPKTLILITFKGFLGWREGASPFLFSAYLLTLHCLGTVCICIFRNVWKVEYVCPLS